MKIKGKEVEIIRSTKYEVAGIKCDVCGRIIEPPTKESQYKWMNDEYTYYEVTTGHHDWGNDSVESIEGHDVCPNCIVHFVENYLKNNKGYRSAYIDIQTEHAYFGGLMEDDE